MKLTIIIPVYNKIRYLSKLLEQVRMQTFSDFECLLIDDGSTDGSGVVCDEFAALDVRFRVFHILNGGVSNARNLGLNHAAGEYITFIDADDRVHPEYLYNLFHCAETSGAAIVIGNLQKVWADRKDIEPLQIPYDGLFSFEVLLPDFAQVQKETGIYGFCVAKLIRRDLVADIRFDPKIKLAEDLNFYLDLYPKIDTICFDRKPYYSYLQAAENSSMLDADDIIDYFTQLKIQLKITRFLTDKGFFTGENRRIMVERIYDYVYFCLFHCQHDRLRAMCYDICNLELPLSGSISRKPVLKRILLFLYRCRFYITIVHVMRLYHWIRSIARKLIKKEKLL